VSPSEMKEIITKILTFISYFNIHFKPYFIVLIIHLCIGSKIHIKKIQQDATVCQNFISYLYEAQHGQQPSTYAKPEADRAVLGS
jgi:hypothetical protein